MIDSRAGDLPSFEASGRQVKKAALASMLRVAASRSGYTVRAHVADDSGQHFLTAFIDLQCVNPAAPAGQRRYTLDRWFYQVIHKDQAAGSEETYLPGDYDQLQEQYPSLFENLQHKCQQFARQLAG